MKLANLISISDFRSTSRLFVFIQAKALTEHVPLQRLISPTYFFISSVCDYFCFNKKNKLNKNRNEKKLIKCREKAETKMTKNAKEKFINLYFLQQISTKNVLNLLRIFITLLLIFVSKDYCRNSYLLLVKKDFFHIFGEGVRNWKKRPRNNKINRTWNKFNISDNCKTSQNNGYNNCEY